MSLLIKDGNGVARTVKSVESGGEHTPVHKAEGPLTDAELRASAVSVTGPVTDAQLRATPVPVSGPATDAQLRATPIAVTISNTPTVELGSETHEVPISAGTFSCNAGAAMAGSITIPADAIGVRLFPQDVDIRFRFDSAPNAIAAGSLTSGGIAKADQWREIRFTAGTYSALYILSGDAVVSGDSTPHYFDVEFFEPAS